MRTKKPKGKLMTSEIVTHAEAYRVTDILDEFQRHYPGATIRTFHRYVKADGLVFLVHIVTVREKVQKS